MKTIENTPARLLLETRPTGLRNALWVVFAASLAAAVLLFRGGHDAGVLAAIVVVAVPTYLFFFLETRQVEVSGGVIAQRSVARQGTKEKRYPLEGLERVVVEQPGGKRVEGTTEGLLRAVLIYGDGREVAMWEGYAKNGEPAVIATALNDWLAKHG